MYRMLILGIVATTLMITAGLSYRQFQARQDAATANHAAYIDTEAEHPDTAAQTQSSENQTGLGVTNRPDGNNMQQSGGPGEPSIDVSTASSEIADPTSGPQRPTIQSGLSTIQDPDTHRPVWSKPDDVVEIPDYIANRGISAEPVTIDKRRITSLQTGDRMSLPVPQTGKDYELVIDSVTRRSSGDSSIKGHIPGENLPYSIVVTDSQQSTFVTMNTPDGTYLLEARGTQGWMTSLAETEQLINPNVKDYIVPANSP